MRILSMSCFLGALVALAGCGGGGTPGGPGANGDGGDGGSRFGTADETFKIDVPFLSTKVTQGESTTAEISLNRGTNFDEDVTLTFDKVPKGVTIKPDEAKISASEKGVTITIAAAAKAALGDFTVKVIGKPTKGADASHELKLTVNAKEPPKEETKNEKDENTVEP